jgi:hypothetical protein
LGDTDLASTFSNFGVGDFLPFAFADDDDDDDDDELVEGFPLACAPIPIPKGGKRGETDLGDPSGGSFAFSLCSSSNASISFGDSETEEEDEDGEPGFFAGLATAPTAPSLSSFACFFANFFLFTNSVIS